MSLLHFAILWLISSRVSTWMSTRAMAIGWSLLSLSFRNVTLLIPFLMLATLMVHCALKFPEPLRSSSWEETSCQERKQYVRYLIKGKLEERKVLVQSYTSLHTISPGIQRVRYSRLLNRKASWKYINMDSFHKSFTPLNPSTFLYWADRPPLLKRRLYCKKIEDNFGFSRIPLFAERCIPNNVKTIQIVSFWLATCVPHLGIRWFPIKQRHLGNHLVRRTISGTVGYLYVGRN